MRKFCPDLLDALVTLLLIHQACHLLERCSHLLLRFVGCRHFLVELEKNPKRHPTGKHAKGTGEEFLRNYRCGKAEMMMEKLSGKGSCGVISCTKACQAKPLLSALWTAKIWIGDFDASIRCFKRSLTKAINYLSVLWGSLDVSGHSN